MNKDEQKHTGTVSSLILSVSSAQDQVALDLAYIAARRPCIDAGRMAELISALDTAESRMQRSGPTPLALSIGSYGMVVRK
ncbi:MAG: hypothetical protein GY822_08315 [Deltaproteobacteria bacterium]|nr:hypothetical protein [Deltaproteobacteria bacterium]